jgi:tRNA threonylcarbamoyl adenosine modification protein (Sua5/YciO/YrdC/YwlC family)
METLFLSATLDDDPAAQEQAIAQAAAFTQAGRVVVYPTDTLYGIGVDAFNAQAINRLYAVKERPREKGIPILLSDAAMLSAVAVDIPIWVESLITGYWPGPLTLVLPRHPRLPANLAPGQTVAVRIPDHEISRRFIRAAGGAVATSSANRSGQEPAATAAAAYAAFAGTIAAVLDGGPVTHGLSSTILDCIVSPPAVLRAGPLPAGELFALLEKMPR